MMCAEIEKMIFDCNEKKYEIILGSDIDADGMYLVEPVEVVLFAFWSDVDGNFTFSAFKQDLPFALVEFFVKVARERLPPIDFKPQQ